MRKNGDATVLTVSESGLGRRTEVSQYRLQSRGGKGIRNYYVDRNGPVAGVKMVDGDDDVILITDDGVIIRIPVQEITVQSRYGGGVRAMRVAEDSRVVTLGARPQGGGRRRGGPGRGAGRSRRRGGAGGGRFLSVKLSPERGQPPAFRGLFARNREVSRKNSAETPESSVQARVFSI